MILRILYFQLCKNGTDVNAQDNWGVTPMYQAASSGQVAVIEYLLAAGAKLSFKNMVGPIFHHKQRLT